VFPVEWKATTRHACAAIEWRACCNEHTCDLYLFGLE